MEQPYGPSLQRDLGDDLAFRFSRLFHVLDGKVDGCSDECFHFRIPAVGRFLNIYMPDQITGTRLQLMRVF